MTIKPTADRGQTIASPIGKVIGYLDSKAEYDAFAEAVLAAGYSRAEMTSLEGEEGVQLLERLQDQRFFFADSEDSVIKRSIRELRQGHYAAAVDVKNHQQAEEIANLAAPHGGHDFTYFGTWVTERLPT